MKYKSVLLLVLFCPLIALASGTFLLEGEIKKFSPDSIDLFDGFTTYTLERKKLGTSEDAKLKPLKSGQHVKLQVPFEAVASTHAEAK